MIRPPLTALPRVSLVGVGPGDPELLTLKALRVIERAEVVVYDRLVSNDILALVPHGVPCVFVGKECRKHFMTQDEINALLIRLAQHGKRVARLKGGDPFIFGRGGEEALALTQAGVPFEVIPGISSASGCAAAAGIPLTHRGLASGVRYLTGHGQGDKPIVEDWGLYADPDTTLVVYMGLTHAVEISRGLIDAGLPATTPAAAIENGTRADQRTLLTTLDALPHALTARAFRSPTLLVIGKVAALGAELQVAVTSGA